MSSQLAQSVHGNTTYRDYPYSYITWPVLIAIIPLFYMIPTIFVIVRIFVVLLQSVFGRKKLPINNHIFLILSLAQFLSFAYFLADYMMLRLPATRFFTTWCTKVEPNQYLKLIFFFTFYFNYAAMILPFLLCLLRLLLIIFPNSHMEINGVILKVTIPLILVYPICFTFFLIPAVGYCRQLGSPYLFGSVSIYYTHSYGTFRNSFFHLGNTCFWMMACLLVNVALFIKLRGAMALQEQGQQKSSRSRRAELSLSITIVSMIMPYFTYCIFTVIYLTVPDYTYYMMIIRPFGNDCETVIVPWIFYLTHPVFASRKDSTISVTMVNSSAARKFTTDRSVVVHNVQ